MLSLLRKIYRFLDKHFLSRMPRHAQAGIRGAVSAVARTLIPAPGGPSAEYAARSRRAGVEDLSLPDWAREEMSGLAREIDASLHPLRFVAKSPETYAIPLYRTLPGEVYSRLLAKMPDGVDAVLLVPWIKRGGADLGVLHHARALKEAFGANTAVIATEPADSPWKSRLPQDVAFVDAGAELAQLNHSPEDASAVMARLMVQFEPKTIHLIGSRHGWEMVRRHGQAIAQRSRIFASLYCDEYDAHGCRVGYAVDYLADSHRWLSNVLTDNSASPKDWQRTLGMDPAMFRVVPFPSPSPQSARRVAARGGRRLLWAGRLDRQKRPDILQRIAELTPQFQWDVHGASVVPGHEADISGLTSLSNVELHGSYERFSDIVRDDHAAFVYTSQWDGLPNVLLEAAAAGLPIVAPAVGGISDLIDTQHLISPYDDAQAYARMIERISESAEISSDWVARQDEAIIDRSWSGFTAALQRVPGYGAVHPHPVEQRSDES